MATPGDREYDEYVRAEWTLFAQNHWRWESSLQQVPTSDIRHVLDVGCGAGQELLPFVIGRKAIGIGVDLSRDAGLAGRELISENYAGAPIYFARAAAEKLPFESGRFDVVICRVALPYMKNTPALAEMARVIRVGGSMIVKIHHWHYYWRELLQGLSGSNFYSAIHALRVLLVGCIYHLTGRQIHTRLTGGETFQTRWLLNRELRSAGMVIKSELADSGSLSPAFLLVKEGK